MIPVSGCDVAAVFGADVADVALLVGKARLAAPQWSITDYRYCHPTYIWKSLLHPLQMPMGLV